MAAGDPDAQRGGPDGESQRPAQIGCFPVDAGVHRRRRAHLKICRSPGSRRGMRPIGQGVKHKDPKPAGVERRASAASNGLIQRVGVV